MIARVAAFAVLLASAALALCARGAAAEEPAGVARRRPPPRVGLAPTTELRLRASFAFGEVEFGEQFTRDMMEGEGSAGFGGFGLAASVLRTVGVEWTGAGAVRATLGAGAEVLWSQQYGGDGALGGTNELEGMVTHTGCLATGAARLSVYLGKDKTLETRAGIGADVGLGFVYADLEYEYRYDLDWRLNFGVRGDRARTLPAARIGLEIGLDFAPRVEPTNVPAPARAVRAGFWLGWRLLVTPDVELEFHGTDARVGRFVGQIHFVSLTLVLPV